MSKKEASIKTTLDKEDIKYMLEQIVKIHHRMILAKQAFRFRDDIEEAEGMEPELDSPEEVIVDLILEDLDKIFLHIGLDVPEPKSLEDRILAMVPRELSKMEKTDMDELRQLLEENGQVLYDYLEDGKEYPN